MNNLRKLIVRPLFLKGMIVLGLLVTVLSWYAKLGFTWEDIDGQWLMCRYFLKGVNPYVYVPVKELALKGLEPIPYGWSTSPWGCLLGLMFYAGFMPCEAAKIWFILLYAAAYILTCVYFAHRYPLQKKGILALAAVGLVSYVFSMLHGNAGGVICLLLLMALDLKDRHNLLAGFCLAFALVKPQVSLLICLYLLFQKNYKVLLVAAIVDIAAWLVVAIRLNAGMFEMLADMLGSDVGCGYQYNGIMTFLSPHLLSLSKTMYLSMAVGITYSTVLYVCLCHKFGKDNIITALPFCVATSFWCYSWGNELLILLPAAAFCLSIYSRTDGWQRLLPYASFILFSFGPIVPLALFKVFGSPITSMEVYSLLCGVVFLLLLTRIRHKQTM